MNTLFDTTDVDVLTDDQSAMLYQLLVAENAELFKPTKAIDLFKGFYNVPFMLGIMVKRLLMAEPTLEYSEGTLMFLAEIAGDKPAAAVMWAWSLVKETRKRHQVITTRMLARDLCPFGFAKEKVLLELWMAQKLNTDTLADNYLDTEEAWRDNTLHS